MTFLNELDLIGCYTDEHATEYDGQAFITPSIIDNDDGKEDNITHGNHENPVA